MNSPASTATGSSISKTTLYLLIRRMGKEAQLRLTEILPPLGQAARIQGVTAAEISLLAVMLRKG
jgi:tRNA uridine 5-carboxymethylaminomethyl modification enzyme